MTDDDGFPTQLWPTGQTARDEKRIEIDVHDHPLARIARIPWRSRRIDPVWYPREDGVCEAVCLPLTRPRSKLFARARLLDPFLGLCDQRLELGLPSRQMMQPRLLVIPLQELVRDGRVLLSPLLILHQALGFLVLGPLGVSYPGGAFERDRIRREGRGLALCRRKDFSAGLDVVDVRRGLQIAYRRLLQRYPCCLEMRPGQIYRRIRIH